MHDAGETWSNGPGYAYPPHTHPYRKRLVCVKGSIVFTVHDGAKRKDVKMKAGDVLELRPGTVHSAVVGPRGVTCTEAHIRS